MCSERSEGVHEAAGFILFWEGKGERLYLLLRNACHGTWSFPKGHLDPGEAPEAGARRELEEETGIERIRILPGFEAVLEYQVPAEARGPGSSPYPKRLHLYLAESLQERVRRSPEHDDGDWLNEADVENRLRHRDLREAFAAALRHLAPGGELPDSQGP